MTEYYQEKSIEVKMIFPKYMYSYKRIFIWIPKLVSFTLQQIFHWSIFIMF